MVRRTLIISGILLAVILLVLGACAPTPAPAPTTAPAPTPTPEPSLPRVGEIVDIGKGGCIMVESFEKREGLGFITILIDNAKGSEDIKVDFLMSFVLEDKKGNMAEIDIYAERDYPALDETVLAGNKLRGTLVYKLAPLGEGLTLYFTRDLSQGYVSIALE